MQFINKRHNWSSTIFRAGSRLCDLTTDFVVSEPSLITTTGYVNFKHRGIAPGAVGVSAYIGYRSAEALTDFGPLPPGARNEPVYDAPDNVITWIPGAKDGGNLRDVTQHYLTLNLASAILLPPAAYRVEVWAFAHTDSVGFETRNDLVEVNRDTGQTQDRTFGFFATRIEAFG
jgi:hypothetical protein